MTASRPDRRITDLQRSAFWIYGVTAMVMREPIETVVRHLAEAGFRDWQVRLEILRIMVVLLFISRLFLASGLYFERVYMQPESTDRYPRRSYPVDFLAGMLQFLVAVAASTAVGLHVNFAGVAPFTFFVALFLAIDWIWLAFAVLRRFSSLAMVARDTRFNTLALIASVLAFIAARAIGGDLVFSDQSALLVLGAFAFCDIAVLIRRYEALD